MLVLTRKVAEKLYIGEDICVTVVRLGGGQVRLGIEAPRSIPVMRAELQARAHPNAEAPTTPLNPVEEGAQRHHAGGSLSRQVRTRPRPQDSAGRPSRNR